MRLVQGVTDIQELWLITDNNPPIYLSVRKFETTTTFFNVGIKTKLTKT